MQDVHHDLQTLISRFNETASPFERLDPAFFAIHNLGGEEVLRQMFHMKTFVSLCYQYQISPSTSPSRRLKAFIHEIAHKYSDLLLLRQQRLCVVLVFFQPKNAQKIRNKKHDFGR